MSRTIPTPPPAEPHGGPATDPPIYRYDPGLGRRDASYTRADKVHPEAHGPEVAGIFAARIEGETIINTMWGRRHVPWVAKPGQRTVILGYWSDGTVHLRWPAISGAYRVEGRFPEWVVTADPTTRLAAGGHFLQAHAPDPGARGLSARAIAVTVLLVIVLLLLLLPPTRDAIGVLVRELVHG